MGLDMYLTKEYYIGGYEPNVDEITFKDKYSNYTETIELSNKKLDKIVEEIGYWRKANQIHRWFVTNVQNNTDDCNKYFVPKEKLEELLKLCKQVRDLRNSNYSNEEIKSKIEKLLPTQAGFFFGNYKYDEWYFDQIQDTIEILEKEIESDNWKNTKANICYYYQSSW